MPVTGEKSRRLLDLIQIVVFLLTALGGLTVGVLDSIGFPLEKYASINLILILLGLMGLNLSLERAMMARRIDRLEDQDVRSHFDALPIEIRPHVASCIQFCEQIYRLRREARKEDEAFPEIVDDLLANQFTLLENLAKGFLNLPYEHTLLAQRALTNLFRERFDAISQSDLDFWLDNSQVTWEYFNINARTIKYGAVVNRIFVFSVFELIRRREDIVEVLRRHQKAGIGWGIAVNEELEPDVAESPLPLDFAMFNGDRVVSQFRKRDGRRFEAIFSTPNNKELIRGHRDLYCKVIAECWMVSTKFKETFAQGLPEEDLEMVLNKAKVSNSKLQQSVGLEVVQADPFVLEVPEQSDIPDKIAALVRIIKEYRELRGLEVPDGERRTASLSSLQPPPPALG